MYYRCVVCWTLIASEYIDRQGDICPICGAGLLDRHAPQIELQTLQEVPATVQVTPAATGPSGPVLAATAYDPAGKHCGSWYRPGVEESILSRSVAILQSKGPGDALRFLHAVLRLLELRHSPHSQIIVFIDQGYEGNVVGWCSNNNLTALSENNVYRAITEKIGELGSILWVVLKQRSLPSDKLNEFVDFTNGVLQFLASEGYLWCSPNHQPPVILEPYHGVTRYYRFTNIQFARIDLDVELMEQSGYLALPRPPRNPAPPNTVRVLLYLRVQGDPERDTPPSHLKVLRGQQLGLRLRGTVNVQVTLAGFKQAADYVPILQRISPEFTENVLKDWGWELYGYGDHNYQQQFAYIAQNYDFAVGVNTSGLDLAAAAGCIILRDREWKQREYLGRYYNLFLLSQATFGIFTWDDGDRKFLFLKGLECVLTRMPLVFEQKYTKCTVSYAMDRDPLTRSPVEEVIGSLT